eukprot:TRINITY_DN6696_c0_g1_i1.p1 TRINITY_DN6696_c0_g1~~TRINITY_DN6696_c0_g1_i1.p1  ORF type:complete len:357 (+),score=37.92 TRINITY_DN6696_c0_g1_i1:120-1073(+)
MESDEVQTPNRLTTVKQEPGSFRSLHGFLYRALVENTPHTASHKENLTTHNQQIQSTPLDVKLDLELPENYDSDDESREEDIFDVADGIDIKGWVEKIFNEIPDGLNDEQHFSKFNEILLGKYLKYKGDNSHMKIVIDDMYRYLQNNNKNINQDETQQFVNFSETLPRGEIEVQKMSLQIQNKLQESEINVWNQLQKQLPKLIEQKLNLTNQDQKENVENRNTQDILEENINIGKLSQVQKELFQKQILMQAAYTDEIERFVLFLEEIEEKMEEIEMANLNAKRERYEHLNSPFVLINRIQQPQDISQNSDQDQMQE